MIGQKATRKRRGGALGVLCFELVACASPAPPSGTSEQSPAVTAPALNPDEVDLLGPEGEPPSANASPVCLGETRQAEAVGFDLFMLLDTSASMLDSLSTNSTNPLVAGLTKWDAVRQAVGQFVSDPATADIGIGLQYFPQLVPDTPSTCSTNAQCGAAGPCSNSVCVSPVQLGEATAEPALSFLTVDPNAFVQCADDSECPSDDLCRALVGECLFPANTEPLFLGRPATLAELSGVDVVPRCATDDDCRFLPSSRCEVLGSCTRTGQVCSTESFPCGPTQGQCDPFVNGCRGLTRCEASAYSRPAVAIRTDAERSEAIRRSMFQQFPQGPTPTASALAGGLQHAQQWAVANPGRQVITVIVTDGFPTDCAPLDVSDIAAIAREAEQSAVAVSTYVVGVFSASDLDAAGRQALDNLAQAGGSGQAFVVDPSGNLSDEFVQTLEAIRRTAVSCDFELSNPANQPLNLDQVNVEVTIPGQPSTPLVRVQGAEACGAQNGWFYSQSVDDRPSQIRICPAPCSVLTQGTARVDLEVGCATRLR